MVAGWRASGETCRRGERVEYAARCRGEIITETIGGAPAWRGEAGPSVVRAAICWRGERAEEAARCRGETKGRPEEEVGACTLASALPMQRMISFTPAAIVARCCSSLVCRRSCSAPAGTGRMKTSYPSRVSRGRREDLVANLRLVNELDDGSVQGASFSGESILVRG